MPKIKNTSVRINIYVHDPGIRRQMKVVAAKKDLSVSEYCLQAIESQLAKEQLSPEETGIQTLNKGVEKARRFHTKHFGKRVFSFNSADLIREGREKRSSL
jgi:hypothetical protein